MSILVVVEDLIFLSKIRQTAGLIDVRVQVIKPEELAERLSAGQAAAAICDLNHRSGLVLDAIRRLKQSEPGRNVPVLGFLSHVQSDLAKEAREAGCDLVMARSAFALRLPQLLREYAARGAPPAPCSPAKHAQ